MSAQKGSPILFARNDGIPPFSGLLRIVLAMTELRNQFRGGKSARDKRVSYVMMIPLINPMEPAGMKLLFDFLPIFFFFIAYMLFDIYTATAVAIATSALQVFGFWLKFRKFDMMQVITLATIGTLGTATIVFHNPLFFKWKPTVIYWAFGIIFLGSQIIGHKPFLQRLMDSKITLPRMVWHHLNSAWAVFFIVLGFVNIYVAYNYSTTTWVYFKFIGAMGCTLVFAIAQSFYMVRFAKYEQ